MAALFGFLVLLAAVAVPVGLIWPKAIFWRSPQPSRWKALGATTGTLVAVIAVGTAVVPTSPPKSEAIVASAEDFKPVAAEPAKQAAPAPTSPAFSPVDDSGIPTIDPSRIKERDGRIIHGDSEVFASAIKMHAPQLTKTGAEQRGEVVGETYVSAPSRVRLVLDTLPSQEGIRPGSVGVIRAVMERPLADKPSPYDDGLAKTMNAFVIHGAADWPMAEQKTFVGECLMTLTTAGCDRTVKGIRVVAKRYGMEAFRMEAYRP